MLAPLPQQCQRHQTAYTDVATPGAGSPYQLSLNGRTSTSNDQADLGWVAR